MTKSFFLSLRSPDALQQINETSFPAVAKALQRLSDSGEFSDRLEDLVLKADGSEAVSVLQSILEQLSANGLLLRSVYAGTDLLATQVPLVSDFSFEEKPISPESKYILSRFAYMRRDQNAILLESPLSHSRMVLYHTLAAIVLHSASQPFSVQELCTSIPELPENTAYQLITLFFSSNFLCEVNGQGIYTEDQRSDLQCWEFHDLLFHSRSRAGRHDHPAGGTYRFAGVADPPPFLKTVGGQKIPLHRPDLDKLQETDPPFARVQENRCSIRTYAETPISDHQLGEFLYRVGRIADYTRTQMPLPGTGWLDLQFAMRPYPSGGGIYEQEFYLVIHRCQNLEAGFYYYDADNHQLIRISNITPAVESLIADAARSTAVRAEQLQVLFLITARFQRVAWKYSTVAYALMLKNLGVLYQTMYLAATAMDLAPCAIGYGNSDLFAKAAGTEYFTETSIGEFLLGSKR